MTNANKLKAEKLGMSFGAACNRLRKQIMFSLLQRLKENKCYRCKKEIETVKELSIEHKKPWMHSDVKLFWDLDNIAFSHLSCNSKAAQNPRKGIFKHPCINSYIRGCRCDECKNLQKLRMRKYR